MRGVIGKKVGMTQVFDENGLVIPVTVIQVQPNVVVGNRTVEKNGYEAVVIGAFEESKLDRMTKPVKGQFPQGVGPQRYLCEFREFEGDKEVGKKFGVEILAEARYVDVIGVSKGKGFQGVMKLFGFKGGRNTHGSKFHRAHGSTGQNSQPSRTFPGMKMAGRMGGERKTIQNLKLVQVDAEKQIIMIKGAVPGTRDGIVIIRTSKKR